MDNDGLCGEMTPNGPCTMKKGHEALWHRHREYDTISWKLMNSIDQVLDEGDGVNGLTYAISRNRVKGRKLFIEVEC